MRIYWAAPLHNREDQEKNAEMVKHFREAGHRVYLPQEHGVLEELNLPKEQIGPTLIKGDWHAMEVADICVALWDREDSMSTGMVLEMGAMKAMHKPVFLLTSNDKMYVPSGILACIYPVKEYPVLIGYLDELGGQI